MDKEGKKKLYSKQEVREMLGAVLCPEVAIDSIVE